MHRQRLANNWAKGPMVTLRERYQRNVEWCWGDLKVRSAPCPLTAIFLSPRGLILTDWSMGKDEQPPSGGVVVGHRATPSRARAKYKPPDGSRLISGGALGHEGEKRLSMTKGGDGGRILRRSEGAGGSDDRPKLLKRGRSDTCSHGCDCPAKRDPLGLKLL